VSVPNGPRQIRGRSLVPGHARGPSVVLEEPVSFWGGMDPATGRLIDPRHPQTGTDLRGSVLLMPSGRGSSSSSSVLAEAVRLRTAPAAVVLLAPDLIVALGSVAARELYGRGFPVAVLAAADYASIPSGVEVEVRSEDGTAVLTVR
jgi:predicted aconitase with swiveling domain